MREQQNAREKFFIVIYFLAVDVALIQWLDFSFTSESKITNISLLIVNCFTEGRRGQV